MKALIVVLINRTTKGGETKGEGHKTKGADASGHTKDVVPTKCGNPLMEFEGIAAYQRFDTWCHLLPLLYVQ